jgi:creatinine amidohydrolase
VLEDHGPHLPLDADSRIATEICRRTAEQLPDEVVLLPTLVHGYTPHHMDFPGPITIGWKTFVDYAVDVGRSLAYHGFKRILFLNGHGSNIPLIDMASRLVGLEHPDVLCAAAFYLSGAEAQRTIDDVRDSEIGGMGQPAELDVDLPGPGPRRRLHGQGGG